jgi:hypothetical protein
MANVKISNLPAATSPVASTDVLPVVQAGITKKANVDQIQFQVVKLEDGVTAPSATVGQAKLYVDSSSGDLKIIFGDGTVKTIVTDT